MSAQNPFIRSRDRVDQLLLASTVEIKMARKIGVSFYLNLTGQHSQNLSFASTKTLLPWWSLYSVWYELNKPRERQPDGGRRGRDERRTLRAPYAVFTRAPSPLPHRGTLQLKMVTVGLS